VLEDVEYEQVPRAHQSTGHATEHGEADDARRQVDERMVNGPLQWREHVGQAKHRSSHK
jgi:hypothetical protein